MNLKKIFGGMKGSNDPRYRTAKPFEMFLAPATSASKMTFYVMMMMTGYVANTGFGVAVMLTGILQTVKTWFDGATDPIVAAIFDKVKVRRPSLTALQSDFSQSASARGRRRGEPRRG